MLKVKGAVDTFDCHALSELLLQSTLPVLQLQLTSTEDTGEANYLWHTTYTMCSTFLKTILNTCYSLRVQHEDDSDLQWNKGVDYSQYHQLRLIAHQGILLLHQFKPFLHQLRVVLFAHSWRKQSVRGWGNFQMPSVSHRDSTQTNTQTMQWQPSRDVSY